MQTIQDLMPIVADTIMQVFEEVKDNHFKARMLLQNMEGEREIIELEKMKDEMEFFLGNLEDAVPEYEKQHLRILNTVKDKSKTKDQMERDAIHAAYNEAYVHTDTSRPYNPEKLNLTITSFIRTTRRQVKMILSKAERDNKERRKHGEENSERNKDTMDNYERNSQNDEMYSCKDEENYVINQETSKYTHQPNLPQLESLKLPKFNGERSSWLNFWTIFKSLIDDRKINPLEKFTYLSSCLTGKAMRLIEPVTCTPDCYEEAIEILKEYYEDTNYITHELCKKMKECRAKNNSVDELLNVSQEMNILLRQLNQHNDHNESAIMTDIILSKFPREWQLRLIREKDKRDWRTNSELIKGIRSLLIKESINNDRVVSENKLNEYSNRHFSNEFGINKQRESCGYCGKHRDSEHCRTISDITQRIRYINENRLCRKCLGTNHIAKDCNMRCKSCNGPHNISICSTSIPQIRSQFPHKPPIQNQKPNYSQKPLSPTMSRPNFSVPKTSSPNSQQNVKSFLVQSNKPRSDDVRNMIPDSRDLRAASYSTNYGIGNVRMWTARAEIINPRNQSREIVDVILDPGSQVTLVSKEFAKKFGLRPFSTTTMSVSTVGGKTSAPQKHNNYQILMQTLKGVLSIECTEFNDPLVSPMNVSSLSDEDLREIERLGVKLSDNPTRMEPICPKILLGIVECGNLLVGEESISLPSGLKLISTSLGRIVSGKEYNHHRTSEARIMLTVTSKEQSEMERIEKYLGIEMILQPPETLKEEKRKQNEQVAKQFKDSVEFIDGRYNVQYTIKDDIADLPTNYQISYRRLISTIATLSKKEGHLEYYDKVIQEQIRLGQVEIVPQTEKYDTEGCHYIPHQGVLRMDKPTTPLRIVYDASTKGKNGKSLNDMIQSGPNLLEEIAAILIRARCGKYLISSDIEKAFLQVNLKKQQRNLLRFLWVKDVKKPVEPRNLLTLRFNVTPFGVSQSPYTLMAVIEHHLESILKTEADEETRNILNQMKRNAYVDNILIPVSETNEKLYNIPKETFRKASMNLREFTSNDPTFNKRVPEQDRGREGNQKILGTAWDTTTDLLSINPHTQASANTKRQVFASTASIYDVLGLIAPITVTHSLFTQSLWADEFKWDEKISEKKQQEWQEICDKNDVIINIPRYTPIGDKINIAIFTDASSRAMGAVGYVSNEKTSSLIMSRSRLAHIKDKSTIPKMELEALLLGYKLLQYILNSICKEFPDKEVEVKVYCDAAIVLFWVNKKKDRTKVLNKRIFEIYDIAKILRENPKVKLHDPKYVSTTENPADYLSRGVRPAELADPEHPWWTGPKWLQNRIEEWPDKTYPDSFMPSDDLPCTTDVNILNTNIHEEQCIDFSRFSKLSRLINTTAYILKWKEKKKERKEPISVDSRNKAFTTIIKLAQVNINENFELVKNGILKKDEKGIWRGIHGRIDNAELPNQTKFPIFIDHKEKDVITLIIRDIHMKLHHQGVRATLNELKMNFWIPRSQSLVKKVVETCVECRKMNSPPFAYQNLQPLPEERILQSKPFEKTGLDYVGPFINGEKKRYVILFTCFVTRLIHLEVTFDMSTEEFLLALRRFIARRGTPSQLLSDQAPTFILANKLLNQAEDLEENIMANLTNKGVKWKFTTCHSPWQGGIYESLVKSVKNALFKTWGKRKLTDIEFLTIVTEIESMLNTRPISQVSSDTNRLFSRRALRPIDFIIPDACLTLPYFCKTEISDDYVPYGESNLTTKSIETYFNKFNERLQFFWELWRKDYLLMLRDNNKQADHSKEPLRGKVSKFKPREGDVVLIINENKSIPRHQWKLGRIEKINGHTVFLRSTSGNQIERPQNLLIPLELHSDIHEYETIEPTDHPQYEKPLTRSRSKTLGVPLVVPIP